jgi:peptide/nickel transport system substrate-binding protein
VTAVEVVDPHTVRISTRGPNPTLPANLATLPIVPREAREKAGEEAFAASPIGSGAYKLVEFVRGQRLVLEANPSYWAGRVTPQRLVLRPVVDPATRVAELKAGGVQIIEAPPVSQLKELEGGNTEPVVTKGSRLMMHAFNTTRKPFDDLRVRQAVNYAIDRDAIIKNVLEGHGEPLHGPFSERWLGYDPNLQPYPYDPAKARQLLAQAGYPSGLETVFNISTGVMIKDREIAEAVASQLAEVGIKVRLIPTERAKLQQDWVNGVFEGITSVVWGAAADPDPMIGWTFYQRKGHQPDEHLNSLIEQSRRTLDPEQRRRVLQEFGHYVHDQAYWMFIHAQNDFRAKRKDVPWELSPSSSSLANQRYYRLDAP